MTHPPRDEMPQQGHPYTPASNPVLRWLTDSGHDVRPDIHRQLLSELFTSPAAVFMGVLNGLVLNGAAMLLCGRDLFAIFMMIDVLLAGARLAILRRALADSKAGRRTSTDACLLTAVLWCALQGSMAFFALRSGRLELEVLSTATIMGLLGPLCARNYPAPRFAMLLVCLCNVPFVAGAASSGNPWMMVLVVQMPLYLVGSMGITSRFQQLAIGSLQAQHETLDQAHHDPLTGLLNRLGFAEASSETDLASRRPAVFYLDLDGFKAVNDSSGHHVGDLLLQAAAQRLLSVTRRTDLAVRLGGDEFLIVTYGMTSTEAEAFADRLIEIVAREPYRFTAADQARIGVSVGFALGPDDGADLDELRRHADRALYRAKAAGKGVRLRFDRSWSATPTACLYG